ncbi:MAG: hypothetical protein LBB91_09760 [Clostridiales bacterium]|jgi:energy-coupling factor transporter ATP-binding protein EcfA2|nr:hypothetical protein [Clostridiales bacterium]
MVSKAPASADMTLADISNLFHPFALTEEQMDFYQKTDSVRGNEGFEFHDLLYQNIKSADKNSHLLVVGHGGCGKSTELGMLTVKLKNAGLPSIGIEAREDLDLNNFSHIDIFMRIVECLLRYAEDNGMQVHKKLISSFYEALATKTTIKYWGKEVQAEVGAEVEAAFSLPFILKITSKISAFLKIGSGQKEELRKEIAPQIPNITRALNAMIDEINDSLAPKGKIIIIIDGLEKCRSDNVKDLFRNDISSLANINTHLVITCPINVYRSPIATILQGYFVNPAIMPMIKTHYRGFPDKPYEDGIRVIKELIAKRVDPSYFEDGVIESIIAMGGGNLRDTCYLVRESAFVAYMRERKTVDMSSYEHAAKKFATDLFFRAEYKYFPAIKAIYDGDHRTRNEADLSELLYAGVVFEYNGEHWLDLHPLIRDYIKNHPGVLDD